MKRLNRIAGELGKAAAVSLRVNPDVGAKDDLVAMMSAGAYGMATSSNYKTRPRAPEVMVSGAEMHLLGERESVAQLIASERLLSRLAEKTVEISSLTCLIVQVSRSLKRNKRDKNRDDDHARNQNPGGIFATSIPHHFTFF